MNPSLQQLKASLPARVTRPPGFWLPYAWLVRSIVEQSEGGRVVSDAVRTVLVNEGLPLTAANERTLRVAYYGIREKEWPIVSPDEQVLTDDADDEQVPTDAPDDTDEQFVLDEELRLELEREISEGFIPDPED